jgi:RNA polymerase sigma factor (sigma-70 family)
MLGAGTRYQARGQREPQRNRWTTRQSVNASRKVQGSHWDGDVGSARLSDEHRSTVRPGRAKPAQSFAMAQGEPMDGASSADSRGATRTTRAESSLRAASPDAGGLWLERTRTIGYAVSKLAVGGPLELSPAESGGDAKQLFLTSLPLIERILREIVRRHAISTADAEELGSWVCERLIEDDYATFRKFRGRSSLKTYLNTVLAYLFADFRNARWGRWRPSAAARRCGPIGIRLEELMYRDGFTLREAKQFLLSRTTEKTERDLNRMAAVIPRRLRTTEVSLDAGTQELLDNSISEAEQADAERAVGILNEVVRAVIETLDHEDRLLTRMRYWDSLSIADIAKVFRVDPKPLYRRLAAIEARIRQGLLVRGMDKERVMDILAEPGGR